MNFLASIVLGLILFTGSLMGNEPLKESIHSKVIETIENSDNIPGLKAEEFTALKPGILAYWNDLVEKGVIEVTATDKEIRPYFVALQSIVEHVLAYELNNNVKSLVGVIHTPMPATPLCTAGSVSQELIDPTIEEDPLRLLTVKARTTIVRDYLFQGGDLYIVYPQDGITKRTEAQQKIYKKELENYASHLFDRPLNCTSIENDLIGAFYLFKGNTGKIFGFAIKMTQANDPQDMGNFGLWFGEFSTLPVHDRISTILDRVLKYSLDPIALPI